MSASPVDSGKRHGRSEGLGQIAPAHDLHPLLDPRPSVQIGHRHAHCQHAGHPADHAANRRPAILVDLPNQVAEVPFFEWFLQGAHDGDDVGSGQGVLHLAHLIPGVPADQQPVPHPQGNGAHPAVAHIAAHLQDPHGTPAGDRRRDERRPLLVILQQRLYGTQRLPEESHRAR